MKLKWLVPIILLTAASNARAVSNVNTQLDIAESVVIVSGNANAGENVCVDIYAEDKTYDDFENSRAEDVLVYRRQIKADKSGEFLIRAAIKQGAGKYAFRVIAESDNEAFDGVLAYTTKSEFDKAVSLLNNADETNIEELVKENKTALGWNSDLYSEISQSGVSQRILKSIRKEKLDSQNPREVVKVFDKAVILEAIAEKKDVDMINAAECFEFDKSFCSAWMKKLSENDISNIYSQMQNRNYADEDEFVKIYEEKVFLMSVEKLNGYENIERLTEDYQKHYDIGIDASLYNSLSAADKKRVNSYVLGKKYDSYSKFAQEYNAQMKNNNPSGGSGGNGGGGGGRKTAGENLNLSVVVKENENNNSKKTFKDIDDCEWAKEAIYALYDKGIISGMDENNFAPNEYVTREQFVKMIVCAYGLLDNDAEADFSDVAKDNWGYRYVASAFRAGIIKGIDEKNFGYGKSITREDAAVIVDRVMTKGENMNSALFDDNSSIADYASEAVYRLVGKKVISGMGNNMFAPKNNCRRCEAAQIIYNMLVKEGNI